MVPFAGWEMPVQYAGVTEEHRAVRQAAGVEGYEARWITGHDVVHHPILMLWGPQADLMRDPTSGSKARAELFDQPTSATPKCADCKPY